MHITFLVNVRRLIRQTISCHKVTSTKSTILLPLVKSLLRRRNKHGRNGRIEAANELSTKIGILITEFRATRLQLTTPPYALLWIINFLSGRTQAVSSCGQTSGWLPVSQSIIQGSGTSLQ